MGVRTFKGTYKEFALYEGDTFIAVGTMKEIAAISGLRMNYLWQTRAKSYKGKYDLIELESED